MINAKLEGEDPPSPRHSPPPTFLALTPNLSVEDGKRLGHLGNFESSNSEGKPPLTPCSLPCPRPASGTLARGHPAGGSRGLAPPDSEVGQIAEPSAAWRAGLQKGTLPPSGTRLCPPVPGEGGSRRLPTHPPQPQLREPALPGRQRRLGLRSGRVLWKQGVPEKMPPRQPPPGVTCQRPHPPCPQVRPTHSLDQTCGKPGGFRQARGQETELVLKQITK